jgi:hypothetical protein
MYCSMSENTLVRVNARTGISKSLMNSALQRRWIFKPE